MRWLMMSLILIIIVTFCAQPGMTCESRSSGNQSSAAATGTSGTTGKSGGRSESSGKSTTTGGALNGNDSQSAPNDDCSVYENRGRADLPGCRRYKGD